MDKVLGFGVWRWGLVALLWAGSARAGLDPSAWSVIAVSSENGVTGEGAHCAIDGDLETQWHTRWHDTRGLPAAEPPHTLTIDLGRPERVSAVRLRARAHGEGGLPAGYRLEGRAAGRTWVTLSEGRLSYRSRMSPHATIRPAAPVAVRRLRLTVTSLVAEAAKATEAGLVLAELEVGTPACPLEPTTVQPVPQSREWTYGGYVWRDRHRDLLAYGATQPARLIFLGDSITHRWGAPPSDETPRTGRAVWDVYYGHRRALNLGYGWDRLENMLWRLEHGELAAADPCLVVIMAGTNNFEVNSPTEIAAGVAALCDAVHAQKPRAHILLLGIFPRGARRDQVPVAETNRLLRTLDGRPEVTFRDIGAVFLDRAGVLTRTIMPDLLHPSAEGYRLWAEAIEPEVAQFLGDRLVPPLTERP